MIWIVLHSNFLTLYPLNGNTDWTSITTIMSAIQSPETAFFYIVYSCCIVEFPIVKMVQLFFNNHRQNITNSSTNSYIRTGVSIPSTRNSPSLEDFLRAWRILINTKHCDVRVVHALANHKSQFCLYWEWRKVYIIFWFGLLVCIIFSQWQDPTVVIFSKSYDVHKMTNFHSFQYVWSMVGCQINWSSVLKKSTSTGI